MVSIWYCFVVPTVLRVQLCAIRTAVKRHTEGFERLDRRVENKNRPADGANVDWLYEHFRDTSTPSTFLAHKGNPQADVAIPT